MAKPKQRVKQVGIRFSESEFAKVKELANKEFTSVSGIVRRLTMQRLRQITNNK